MIICKICNKSFEKQITNSHLKKHNITTFDYKKKFGQKSLSSENYRKEISEKYKGEKNPNFGNRWSSEKRKKLSEKLKGKIPYNKNKQLSEETKEKIRKKALERHRKWKEENKKTKAIFTKETKQKISLSVKEYASKNRKEIRERAKKAIETKIKKGYFKFLRKKFLENYKEKIEKYNIKLLNAKNNCVLLKCEICDSLFKKHIKSNVNERTCRNCNPTLFSKNENELYEFLKNLNIEIIRNDRTILGNSFELDFFIPSKNIAIEYNGLYWHSEKRGKSKWYHRMKREKCEEKGITLIQIFEDEWLSKKEIVENRLKIILGFGKTIYARKCKIEVIDKKTAKSFVDKHHLYGYVYAPINYGLFYEDNLVAVMTFTRPSLAKNQLKSKYDFELSRYCSIERVVGAASKLFSKFVEDYNPNTVVSYCDLRWKSGNLYEKLGFQYMGTTYPNYWYTKDYVSRVHRFKLRKKENEDKNKTEWEIRKEEGWDRIWDCGHEKYIWKKNN